MAHEQVISSALESQNTTVTRRNNEDFVFAVEWAAFGAFATEEEIEILFYVSGKRELFPNSSNAEVSVFLPAFDLNDLVGKRFYVPNGYDESRGDHISCFYLYEHGDFNQINIEILGRSENRFHVRWTGVTGDMENRGDELNNNVFIDAVFEMQNDRDAVYNIPTVSRQKRKETVEYNAELTHPKLPFDF